MKTPRPRKEAEDFAPYVPGRSIEEIMKEYGLNDVIKLASNESLWGPPREAVEAAREELGSLNYYPQSDPPGLKKLIAGSLGVDDNCIILGNGTDEVIELICRTFLSPGESIAVSENSFVRYKMGAMLMGVGVTGVPQNNFRISLKGLAAALGDNTKIVFVDNPCNPTGTYVNSSDIRNFVDTVSEMDNPPLLVFDEAYFEYADAPDYSTALSFTGSEAPVMVLRTFSKIYGLAGLRIGYGVADAGIISLINRVRPPFNTNRVAQAAAAGALGAETFVKRVAAETIAEKRYLYEQLGLLGIEYVESQTNFILLKSPVSVTELCGMMLSAGIILRGLSGYSLDEHVRVTVGRREHNELFIKILKEILRKEKKE